MSFRIFHAYLDDQNLLTVEMDSLFASDELHFTLEEQDKAAPLSIQEITSKDGRTLYTLTAAEALDLDKHYLVYDQDRNKAVLVFRYIVQKPIFDDYFCYDGDDLGACYRPQETTFKFWAPISQQVLLQIEKEEKQVSLPMTRQDKGVWETTISGDWEKARYHYLHKVNGEWLEVHDPYALSSEANSGASFVIDCQKLLNGKGVQRAQTQLSKTKAIIYEMSVRDFSSQKEAAFAAPGKFTALTESPQLKNRKLGMQYLKDLGITHIQLMPVYDFGSVDENHPELVYNWGYDPVQYNLPDGSFSSKPNDPYARILELQKAIAAYHEADMSVIMDVVYNHVYDADSFAFEKIVPGYFYRLDKDHKRTNGTFCGNDVASERAMVRRYIIQSVKQWLNLYGFDGFRFDLMGILDIETMQQLARELRADYANVYLYGEGWKMETGLSPQALAHQYNASQLADYGFFSDDFRDTIKKTISKGQRVASKGWTAQMANVLTANVGLKDEAHFLSPQQAVHYVECHDNATAFDYFKIENPSITKEERMANARLALHIVLLSQGIPFLHSGQEFFRSKDLLDNTYNLADSINRLDWQLMLEHEVDVDFVRDLIDFRKNHPILSLESSQEILQSCKVEWLNEYLLKYSLHQQDETLTILINFGNTEQNYQNNLEQELLVCYPTIHKNAPRATAYSIPAKQLVVLR